MATESRTKKSLRNSVVSLIYFGIRFILNFYSRKVFLDYLGTEILGLNTTAVSILQFLNLAELGIGTAVGFSLYKPIFNHDENAINEIVSLQGHLYRRIANLICIGSCVVMCFFPLIFKKADLPLWYAYASYLVLLYAALLGYYVNYRQIVLSAAQMDYKIQLSTNTWTIVKLVCQIIALQKFSTPYIWWLGLEVFFTSTSAISLSIVTHRAFPFLRKSKLKYKELKFKYGDFITKIKQLFVHQIAAFALGQSASLVIYGFTNLTIVALYGNYLIIVNGIMSLMSAVFNSIGAGIGNLVAEGDKSHKLKVFNELFSLRFIVSSLIIFCLITCGQAFITLWIGKKFLLPLSSLCLISLILFIRLNRFTVNNFINAHGLYKDIWAPIAEAFINIGLSVLFGFFWGLNGILAGVLVSLILIVDLWKPFFLFKEGMGHTAWLYFRMYGVHILCGVLAAFITFFSVSLLSFSPESSWMSLISYTVIMACIYTLCLTLLLFLLNTGIRDFLYRINLIKK
ncbi:sugar transporter [bacterium]|nr:sugar transporter [bacterium]